jgi:hypothetical protein
VTTHLVIPDLQVKPDVPLDHLDWIGQLIVDEQPDTVIQLGDLWDMPSLSQYDRGTLAAEGRRYETDVEAGNEALRRLNAPLDAYNYNRAQIQRRAQFRPRRVLLRGNHEDRISRAINADPRLDGALSLDHLVSPGWEVHDFLTPITIDGVTYSHYFYNHGNGRPISGAIETRLRNIGHSFTQGHQQILSWGMRFVLGAPQMGLVCGSAYLHSEGYRGPQAEEWRGVVICRNVENGAYDPEFVSLASLCLRYEGVPLTNFLSIN